MCERKVKMNNFLVPDSDDSEDDVISPDLFSDLAIDANTTTSTSSMSVNVNSLNEPDPTVSDIPQEIWNHAKEAESLLIPSTSKPIYDRTYHKFHDFLKEKKIKTVNETVLLGYFNMLKRPNGIDPNQKVKPGLAPTSLWAIHSMLKSTLLVYDKIDISNFHKVSSFLSSNSKHSDHVKKKANIFTDEELARFLETAPDKDWLAVKVTCILGIHGFCRQLELYKLSPNHIEDHNTCLNIKLIKPKNGSTRPFSLTGTFCDIVKKYIALRPSDFVAKPNFFLRYADGKCHREVIGLHTLADFPKKIASYLGLKNPEKYTGHSWRRTGATIGVEAGMNILDLKKVGGWKSSTVAEGYYDTSRAQLNRNSSKISNAIIQKMTPSSTITKEIPKHSPASRSNESSQPSTSNSEGISLLPKHMKLASESSKIPPSVSALDNVLQETDRPQSVPNQVIHLHINKCTGFNFFGHHDKENL